MNLPKPMQHHSLPPRPQHIRHPMHQGPMHPGHPPPPHLAMNMGPPPQQQPHHMPNAPAPHGQQFGMPQLRDQNRLGHHQIAQHHPQQRVNNQMQPNHMRPQKGRQPHFGGGGQLKHATQKTGPPPSMRNNNTEPTQLQQRLPPPLPINGGPQLQLMKAPPQAQLQQGMPPSHLNPQQIAHLSRPPPVVPHHTQLYQQYQQKQLQNHAHRISQRPLQQQTNQHHQQQIFSHPRTILQNPNRVNHIHQQKNNVPTITPLPTLAEVEAPIVSSTHKAKPATEKLSAIAENFTPETAQITTSSEDKGDNESGELLTDILSAVMKGDSCFSNAKEKTPMCLVNELARYNKIQHQYRLTSENGPAHCKRFTVTLKLGDEEYSAEGYKIKKAQHTAAADAIKKTKYKHPLPKAIRRPEESLRTTITPTVELNALAMKLGQQTFYVFDPRSQPEPTAHPPDGHMPPNQFNHSRMLRNVNFPPGALQQRYVGGRGFPPKFPGPGRIPSVNGMTGMPYDKCGAPPELCKITLVVGKQKFVGTGRTLQSAKHDAASRALQVLNVQAADKFKEILTRTAEEGDWKSPISLVHEIAIKRSLTVVFKVLREEGPAHMKNFITTCEVGSIVTQGDGNGKKISKKRAAEKMLEELKKLPPPSPSKSPPVKRIKIKNFKRKSSPTPTKKKGSSSIREKTESECAEDANPISRLIQIQQSRNEKEPVYEYISKSGESKKREFIMEVSVPGKMARGIGASKKLAKRNAARNLLIEMGIDIEDNGNEENNSQIANQNSDSKVARKVKFDNNNSNQTPDANVAAAIMHNANGGSSGRQIVPGVLLLREHSKDSDEPENSDGVETLPAEPPTSTTPQKGKCTLPAAEGGSSVRPKDQLMYLAQILGFQANFSDYPKGNHSEFLTIVTLSTAPPQICHGVGLNIDESQDQAASAALQILSKLGLDNIKPKADDSIE